MMSSINAFQLIPSLSRDSGGLGVFMSDLSFHYAANNISATIVTEACSKEDLLPVGSNVKLSHPNSPGVCAQFRRAEICSLLDELDANRRLHLMHTHGIWDHLLCCGAKWSTKMARPLVISPHGMLEPWALSHKRFKKCIAMSLYQRRVLNSAMAFHACSHQEALNIRKLGFRQPIAVIPNGVEMPHLTSKVVRKDEKKRALFLSRINPKKGLPMLLEAWKRIAPSDWTLVLAGNDDSNHLQLLERKIKDLNIQDQVGIAGPLFGSDKESAFVSADLFILPSYSENFGIVVTEALSYGVPVLTTTGCPWEELQSENCGWWVSPTPAGIEDGLRRAFNTTCNERHLMGIRGRDLVQRNYLWPAIADKMHTFYRWLLDGGKAPRFVQFYEE